MYNSISPYIFLSRIVNNKAAKFGLFLLGERGQI